MKHSSSLVAALALSSLAAATLAACGGAGATGSSSGAGGTSSGSGSGAGGAGSADAQVAQFCADTIVPFCEALFACCTDPQTLARWDGSVAACEMKANADCQGSFTSQVVPRIKAGETSLNQARLAACVSTLKSMKAGGASCVRPPAFVWNLDCAAAFEGKILPGVPCDGSNLTDLEHIICDKGTCSMGTCVPYLPLGASCTDPNLDAGGCNYVDGQVCLITGGAGKCAPLGQIGDAVCVSGQDPALTCYSMTCDMNLKCSPANMLFGCRGG